MKFYPLNEQQTKRVMQEYQTYMQRKRECEKEIKAMCMEMKIWRSGELENEAESRQMRRNLTYTSSAKGGKAPSKTEKAAFCFENILDGYKKKIIELCAEVKRIETFTQLVDEQIEQLPYDEQWLMKEHYRNGREIRFLAHGYEMDGDGRDRVTLWRLERKARRKMSIGLAEKSIMDHLDVLQRTDKKIP